MVVVPDDIADEDSLGHDVHADALVEMIRSVASKGSFTIGVYGQWGQGKTSMLRQIQQALSEQVDFPPDIVTVWFNPWQYASDEHLIIPFFHTFIAALGRKVATRESGDDPSGFRERVETFLKKLVHVPVALAYGLEGEIKIPLLLKSKFSFDKIIDESRRAEEALKEDDASERLPLDPASIDRFESRYYNLLQDLRLAASAFDAKVVVFIDDLDRCLPEKAVQLLEGMKVLLDLPGFVFVIGVAREVIERGIRVRYRELFKRDGGDYPVMERDYLDKIVQFPVSLPPADPDKLKDHISEKMAELAQARPFIGTILETLGGNPRTLKRFINAVSFSLWVAERKQRDDTEPFMTELLIKMSLIAFLFPDLYRQLEDSPYHLIRIQAILKARDLKRGEMTEEEAEATPVTENTKIPKIDRWLDETHADRLSAILRLEERPQEDGTTTDKGFSDPSEVKRYVFMLTPALTAEAESGASPQAVPASSVKAEIEGRMLRIDGNNLIMSDDGTGKWDVTVSSFKMDRYPVTQSLYKAVTSENPSKFKGDDRPVERVSWFEAAEFCNRLSEMCGLPKAYEGEEKNIRWLRDSTGFRLPTEAEWELACRAGTSGERYGELDRIAWYRGNSEGSTHGVGQKEPNACGLYDMLGNVWEWCWDWHASYPNDWESDPIGPERGTARVFRGGSWGGPAGDCRSARRGSYEPVRRSYDVGFRLARSS